MHHTANSINIQRWAVGTEVFFSPQILKFFGSFIRCASLQIANSHFSYYSTNPKSANFLGVPVTVHKFFTIYQSLLGPVMAKPPKI